MPQRNICQGILPIERITMHFNDFIQHIKNNPSDSPHRISAEWGQGRAIFGGVMGAVIYTAMRRDIPTDRCILSFMMSFIAPLTADTDFIVDTKILRAGKNSVQIEGQIIQEGQTIATALALFGTLRTSSIDVSAMPAPRVPSPESLAALPYIPNVVPEFTRKMDYRWAFGHLPFSGTTAREMGGWMRLKNETTDIGITDANADARLIALIDAWPPATLPLINRPAPASTMTWSISFIQPSPITYTPSDSDWLLYRADIDHAASGYGQIRAHIWNQKGELLALSSQTVAVFD